MLEQIHKHETAVWTALCVLVFSVTAHGYRFVNLMFNGDSLLLYQTDQSWKYSIGRIFQPFYWKVRGDLVAPMLIATFATLYFMAAVILIVHLFRLRSKWQIAFLCGLLTINITTTSTYATDFHEGDTYMLSLLCAVLCVVLFRKKHLVLASGFACLCLGLYQAYIQVVVGLLILLFIQDLLNGESARNVLFSGLKSLATLLCGGILYTVVMKLILKMHSIELADHYNGLTGVGDYNGVSVPALILRTYQYIFHEWLHPQTFRSSIIGLINAALLLLAVAGFLWLLVTKVKQLDSRILLVVLLLVLPFGLNVVYFISKGMEHTLMTFSFWLVYLFILMILQRCPKITDKKLPGYLCCAAMGLCIWCNLVYANQTYLKIALAEKATDAFMNRVVDRLEQTEGYVPGETPIAIVGLMPTSPLYKGMDGFEDVTGRTMDAYTVSWEHTYYLYLDNILNYPVKESYLPEADQKAVDAMPVFPADGCCAFIGDTLVIKIGSTVVTGLG